MRRGAGAAVVLLVLAGCAGGAAGGSSHVCEAPSLSLGRTTVSPGGTVSVEGRAMQDGCADSVSVDEQGNQVANETEVPLEGIELQLTSGDGPAVPLALVNADEDGAFTVNVTIPADTPLGDSRISADVTWAEPVEITVVP